MAARIGASSEPVQRAGAEAPQAGSRSQHMIAAQLSFTKLSGDTCQVRAKKYLLSLFGGS
jgi:hypothetical protein